jgi:DNA-binding transcriptional MerR regulator
MSRTAPVDGVRPVDASVEAVPADGKAATAFRTIGEVTRALKIAPHVLRYWEEQFPMLRPVKRSGGRRYYRPEDMALLEEIDRLVHRQGYTLRGARKVLESRGKAVRDPALSTQAPTLLEGLIAIRGDLAGLLKD